MLTDPISDMLTRIRNASRVRKTETTLPYSKMKFAIAKILKTEGYIKGVEVEGEGVKKTLVITLKYNDKAPTFESIKRISTPGRRVYQKADELQSVLSGLGMSIISTSNGLMTNKEARSRKLGGEVICEIF